MPRKIEILSKRAHVIGKHRFWDIITRQTNTLNRLLNQLN